MRWSRCPLLGRPQFKLQRVNCCFQPEDLIELQVVLLKRNIRGDDRFQMR